MKISLLECVPNFSEGRDRTIIGRLVQAVKNVKGVALLDQHLDPDHNRCVLTFVGELNAISQAAFEVVKTAVESIDLTKHAGEHPRIGVADVVPFVPIQNISMEDCITVSKGVAERIGRELKVPVFLYEEACPVPIRKRLEKVRKGGLTGLAHRMTTDPLWRPDYGPNTLHPTAGALVIGARQPLIAYNIVLQSQDLAVAQTVAKTIRESNGGFPAVKALGMALHSRGLVQVSINLTDFQQTSLYQVFEAVEQEARRHGVEIVESELIGLIPQAAIRPNMAHDLKFARFGPAQVLETRIQQALAEHEW